MSDRDAEETGAGGTTPGPVTRRTLLEWLGKASVVGLFSPLIEACGHGPGAESGLDGFAVDASFDLSQDPGSQPTDEGQSDRPGTDQGNPDEDSGNSDVARDEGGSGCDFAPGPTDHPVMQGWGERTVDQQDLAGILATWQLTVDGMVSRPRTFSFCELRDLGLSFQATDFHCVEGWSILDVPWDGVQLSRILDLVEPDSAATFLKITCRGGTYTESLSVDIAREPRSLLGLGIGGNTLPLKHGFPCRIVVPRLLGYKNSKYIERIELVTSEHVGFWPKFGYTVHGEVPAARLREGKY